MTTSTLRTSHRRGRSRRVAPHRATWPPALPPAGRPRPRYRLRYYLLSAAVGLLEALYYVDFGSWLLDALLDMCEEAYFLTLFAKRPPQGLRTALLRPAPAPVS